MAWKFQLYPFTLLVSVPPLWLIFALSYCGLNRFLTRRNVSLIWIIPVITIAMALTNNPHSWVWFVAFVYAYALLLAATLILVRKALAYWHELGDKCGRW